MADLIDRLRALTPSAFSILYDTEVGEPINPDGPEAAAEIERLQSALTQSEEREKRLREALELLVTNWRLGSYEEEGMMIESARAALNETSAQPPSFEHKEPRNG